MLWLQPISGAISLQFKWHKSSVHNERQCKLKLARVWRGVMYYTMTSHCDVLDLFFKLIGWTESEARFKISVAFAPTFPLERGLQREWKSAHESARAELFQKPKLVWIATDRHSQREQNFSFMQPDKFPQHIHHNQFKVTWKLPLNFIAPIKIKFRTLGFNRNSRVSGYSKEPFFY